MYMQVAGTIILQFENIYIKTAKQKLNLLSKIPIQLAVENSQTIKVQQALKTLSYFKKDRL